MTVWQFVSFEVSLNFKVFEILQIVQFQVGCDINATLQVCVHVGRFPLCTCTYPGYVDLGFTLGLIESSKMHIDVTANLSSF